MTSFGKTLLRSLMIVLALVIISTALDLLGADPLDTYELVAAMSDPPGQRHAEIFRHHYADASTTLMGIWIWSGRRRSSTPDNAPRGKLEFVWSGSPKALGLTWGKESNRLSIEVAGPVDVRSDNGDFNKCLFGYDKHDLLLATWSVISPRM
jgi:hypothetical protein